MIAFFLFIFFSHPLLTFELKLNRKPGSVESHSGDSLSTTQTFSDVTIISVRYTFHSSDLFSSSGAVVRHHFLAGKLNIYF